MAFLPVVTREMSVLSRRQSTYWSRAVTAVIAVLTMLWLLIVSASRVSLAELGSSIFLILSGFCFGFTLLVGTQATSDCVSEEKREGTLGLLFLTDLKGIHIIAGKMAASSLNAFFAVLGVVPMLSLAILLGGVTLTQIAKVALVLMNSMFLSLSIGVFVSTLSKNERKAMLGCLVGLFIVTLMPFILSLSLSEFEKFYPEIIWLSPLYSFICVQITPGRGFNTDYFYQSLIVQNVLAWILLGGASRILPRCINELPPRRFQRLRSALDNYVYGRKEQRARYRASLLDRNAFLWLASRERVKPKYAWVVVGFFAALFLWVALEFPAMFYDPPVALAIIFLVHFVLKIWTASEVCSRLINDRRSGALELLLSSPLSVREITDGQGLALRRIFRWPVAVLVLGELVLLFLTVRERSQDANEVVLLYLGGITTLLLDLWALKWVGLWLSLFGKSIERVLIASLGRILAIPWVLFAVIAGSWSAIAALQSERIPASLFYGIWWTLSVIISGAFGLAARRNVLAQFREIATQQLQAGATLREERRKERKLRAPADSLWRALPGTLRRRWLLTSTALFLSAILLTSLARRSYWKYQVSLAIQRFSKQYPATGATIGQFYPALPASQNAFAHLQNAGRVNWGRWAQPNAGVQLFTRARRAETNLVHDCRQIVAGNSTQLAALRELDQYSAAYMDPLINDGWSMPVDISGHLALASADLILALNEQDRARIRINLRSMLHLTELLRKQPLSLLQNYGHHSLLTLSSALELVLAKKILTPEDLLELQLETERLTQLNPLAKTLRLERARLLDRWGRAEPGFPGQIPAIIAAANGLFAFAGSQDRLLAGMLKDYELAIKLSNRPRTALFEQPSIAHPNAPAMLMAINPWMNLPGSQIFSMAYTDTIFGTRLALLRAGIAAERYRQTHGDFPATLDVLVPSLLDAVPVDPFTNAPILSEQESGLFRTRPAEARSKSPIQIEKISFEIRLK